MSQPRALSPARPVGPALLRLGGVVAASVLLGGLTSLGQGLLPEAVRSFANSASGWTILTVVLVYTARLEVPWSAVAGAGSFVALVLGYTTASQARGLSYSPVLFGVVGLLVGPFVGTCAGWLRRDGWRPHAAAALLGGIAVGEAAYGLTVIRGTTSAFYWLLVGVLGILLVAAVIARRPASRAVGLGAVVGTVVVAVAFVAAYLALGSVGA